MGRMQFPDPIDRPARTVVATQLGRETLVLTTGQNGSSGFRRVTVRECASIQTFPINYYFCGNSFNSRYRQAGDAVPPLLSLAIAREILRLEGLAAPETIIPQPKSTIPPAANPRRKHISPRVLPRDKTFRSSLPGKEIRGCRLDFDNLGDPLQPGRIWSARLTVGEGRQFMRQQVLSFDDASTMILRLAARGGRDYKERTLNFTQATMDWLQSLDVTAEMLQERWTRRSMEGLSPTDICDHISSLVNNHFPRPAFSAIRVVAHDLVSIVPKNGLLARIVAAAFATAAIATVLETPIDVRLPVRKKLEAFLSTLLDSQKFWSQVYPCLGPVEGR
jgi:DNA (cytosine-5)-methyltransferase 1